MTNMDSLSLASDADPDRVAAHPRVQRVPAKDITLFIRRDFLNAEECASLIARIEANRRPSTIADANGDGYFRTSDTCDLDHADPFIMAIDRKLSHFLGIDPAYGEPIQGNATPWVRSSSRTPIISTRRDLTSPPIAQPQAIAVGR